MWFERGISMVDLSFEEKAVLTLYQKFYDEEYPVPKDKRELEESERMTNDHVKAQKMCYLLNLAGLNIGGFSYSWNTYGPFSPGLLVVLRGLDRKYMQVRAYYDKKLSDDVLYSSSIDSVFWPESKTVIQTLKEALRISENKERIRDWVELLGSIAYISINEYPHGCFEWINDELKQRKRKYINDDENNRAWEVLRSANLLPGWDIL